MSKNIVINKHLSIPLGEIKFRSVRSGGPGGQHVNKVETAVQLRFNVEKSSLPDALKALVLASGDKRISKKGVLVLRAEQSRSQESNKEEAIQKLIDFIKPWTRKKKKRIKTKPTASSKEKKKRSKISKSVLKKTRRSPLKEFD